MQNNYCIPVEGMEAVMEISSEYGISISESIEMLTEGLK